MVGDIKHVVVIQSLSPEDKKTGKELYEDVIKMHINFTQPPILKMTHKYHDVSTKDSFIEVLKFYVINSEYMAGGIVIHLEMHGSSDKAGLVLGDGTMILWEELVDLLRQININTKNNLYLTMATCFGRYMFEGVSDLKKSPYSGYISASKEVMPDEIITDFSIVFETLIATGNLVYSYLQLEEQGSNFFYMDSERTFEINFEIFRNDPVIRKQVLDSSMEAIRERINDNINDEVMDRVYYHNLNEIYRLRKQNFIF